MQKERERKDKSSHKLQKRNLKCSSTLLLVTKVREGPLFEGEGVGGACMILWSKGRSLIGACALIIRESTVTFQSETL